jgi:alkyl sulfatase BDS1-like metallo-beta-lactamase superfamily hydrolase
MAGGVGNLLERAESKFVSGDWALASHLIEWAVAAAPEDRAVHAVRMKIYAARAAGAVSTMSHGIFRAAAVESAERAGVAAPDDFRKM